MNKKIISIIIAIIIIVLVIVSVTKTKNSDTVKIGFLTFQTGPVAIPGQMSVAAAQYAEDVVNKNGGINGKKLEVFIEDYAYDAKRAIPAYQALKTKGADYIIFEGSPAAGAVAPVAKQNKDLLITGVTTLPSYTDNDPLTCRIGLTADNYGPAIAKYITDKKADARVAFIVPSNDYGKGIEMKTTSALTPLGATVVDVETYDQTSGDYRTQIAKLKSLQNKIDYIVLIHTASTIESLLKQMKELGLNKPVVTDGVTAANPALKDKTLVEGMAVADYQYTPAVQQTDSEMVRIFKEEYKKRSGFEPITVVGTTYDAILMVSKAVENGAKNPQDVSNYFLNKMGTYEGVTGSISFNSDCESKRPVVYRVYKGGVITDIK